MHYSDAPKTGSAYLACKKEDSCQNQECVMLIFTYIHFLAYYLIGYLS